MIRDAVKLVLWDDGRGEFGPLCDLAPAFALRSGAATTRERIERAFGAAVAASVPPHLAAVTEETTGLPTRVLPAGDAFLFVNARLPDPRGLPTLADGEALVAGDEVIAARLARADAEAFLARRELPSRVAARASDATLVRYPWQILERLGALIAADVEALLPGADAAEFATLEVASGGRIGPHPVLVHRTATIAPQVVFDASAGPIVVGERCVVRPFSVLCGPCAIGASSIVVDRTLLKPAVSCGPQCRLAGEIGGTSILARSNKAHDGHLGDSILGEWVNLGAGTDNSNLLNTYGEVIVRLEPDGPRHRSGRIFLGAMFGDHVKCAIGTRIMTGTVLGTGAMIASSRPPATTVRRFAWLTDDGERRYAIAKFIEVAKTVMARRGATPGPAYLARLAELHASSGRGSDD